MHTVKKATRHHTKAHNQRLILRTIYDRGQISRADIARRTGLTRTTVSTTISKLMKDGLVEEIGVGSSAGGKPPTLLHIVDNSRHLIGLDLANRIFQGAIFDLRGNIIHRRSLSAENQTGEAAVKLVYDLIDELMALTSRPVLGIGIGTPGLMDVQQGIVRKAVNLGWYDLPLRACLQERYDLPVHIANDSQVAALAEYTFGASQGQQNLIVIKAGRGTSAGLIINRQLYQGTTNGASEIGHVRVVDNGEPCPCGNTGCLETVASSQALVRQAQRLALADPNSALHQFVADPARITTDTVLEAFDTGDAAIVQLVTGVGRYLGVAVAHLIGVLNIQQIIISGSLARFGDTLLVAIREAMQAYASALISADNRVEFSTLEQDIVICGTAALLLSQELAIV
ncbi:MAG: ROK family transcriptional regulator [Anaerolineae bacterium]|nr:ROK family transcriptional regulator [Anaerolineae bacterium]